MDLKFNCSNPACRKRLAVDESMAGRTIPCPDCATMLSVPASASLKFNCSTPDCGQHIVVDVSEAGRFIRCPSCGKPLQIPGDPAKPIVAKPLAGNSSGKPASQVFPPRDEFFSLFAASSAIKRLLYGWGVGACLFFLLTTGFYLHSQMIMPGHFKAMAEEILSVGEFRGAPLANHQDTAVVYPRDIKDGGGIFLADFTTHKNSLLIKQEEGGGMDFFNINMFGWSPDDRYLVLPQRTGNADSSHRLAIYDVNSATLTQTFDLQGTVREVVWINTNSLVAMIRPGRLVLINLETDSTAPLFGAKGVVELGVQSLDKDNRRYWLTRTSDHETAYIDQGNVWSLDVATGKTRQLSQLKAVDLEWLDFNPKTGDYLFNLSDNKKRREWLYRFNPDLQTSNGLTRVVVKDISKKDAPPTPVIRDLKGQWIQGGEGVAFVKESLFVQPDYQSYATNLFANGYVQSYSVSPGQTKLYAVAAFDPNPLEIWQYDIPGRKLSKVVPALENDFAVSQVIPIEEKRFNGKKGRLSYKFVPPANLDEHKKYPALVCVPHGSHWTPDSQLIANAGIYYVFVPGRSLVSNPGNLTPVAEEMLTAYYALLENPNVDPHRIYIMGESHQTADLTSLLEYNPTLWRGAIFAPPVSLPEIPANPAGFPSILISIGTSDNTYNKMLVESFTKKAFQKQLRLRVVYHAHGSHILASTDLIRERYEAIAKFILQGY